MIFEDVGLRLDERALKAAYEAAKQCESLDEFFSLPLKMFFAPCLDGEQDETFVAKLALPLKEFGLKAATRNALANSGYKFVWQVAPKSDAELRRIKNFGRRSALPDFKAALERLGIPHDLARWNRALIARAKAITLPDWEEK